MVKLWEQDIETKSNGGGYTNGKDKSKPIKIIQSKYASEYSMRSVTWFWKGRFALGKIGIVAGHPDQGKGQFTCFMCSAATAFATLPCGEGKGIHGKVLLLTAEDGIEDTIIPRLVAAGADLTKVKIIGMVNHGEEKGEKMFSLKTDLDILKKEIIEVGNVVMVIIDPVSAYMGVGEMDSYRSTDVRGVLGPLKELAEELKVLVLGVMHFNKKVDVTNAMMRISDSLAYVAAARHTYIVADDPDNHRKLFVKAKNNLGPDLKALSYTITSTLVGTDPDNGDDIIAPYIVWGSEHVEVTANQAMQGSDSKKSNGKSSAAEEAKEFLRTKLRMGEMKAADLMDEAMDNGITKATLRRAKVELGVKSEKDRSGGKGGWVWSL